MDILLIVPSPFGAAEATVVTGAEVHLQAFLLAFAILAAGFLGWLLLCMTRERLTFETVLCPSRQRVAEVVFRRTWDGTRLDVLACSLLGKASISCGRECMRESASRREKK